MSGGWSSRPSAAVLPSDFEVDLSFMKELPRLGDSYEKLIRTEAQLEEIEAMIANHEIECFRIAREEDAMETEVVYCLRDVVQPSPQIAVRVGEAGHNIRSSLDYLLNTLVVSSGAVPNTRNEFPILRTANENEFKKKTRGLTEPWTDWLRSLQPYEDSKPERHPMSLLYDLNIMDKHRRLHTVLGSIGGAEVLAPGTWNTHSFHPVYFEEGCAVMRVKPLRGQPLFDVSVDVQVKVGLFFGSESDSLAGLPVVETLNRIWQFVNERVFGAPEVIAQFNE